MLHTCLGPLKHEGNGHHDVVGNRETNLKIGAEGELHAQKNIGKDGHELSVRSGLGDK